MEPKSIFILAAKDHSLGRFPKRIEENYVLTLGQLSIMKDPKLPSLKELSSQFGQLQVDREKIVIYKKTLLTKLELTKTDLENKTSSADKIEALENERRLQVNENLVIKESIEKHDIESSKSEPTKRNNILEKKSSNSIWTFIMIYFLTDGVVVLSSWSSLRVFLSESQLIVRCIGILVIFLLIHIANSKKKSYIAFKYFQFAAIVLLFSAMLTGPILSVIYPEEVNNEISWESAATLKELSSTIPWLVNLYRILPIEPMLVSILFFIFSLFAIESVPITPTSIDTLTMESDSVEKQASKLITQGQNKLARIDEELELAKQAKEISASKGAVLISGLLDQMKLVSNEIEVLDSKLTKLQCQFEDTVKTMIEDLDLYASEFDSLLSACNLDHTVTSVERATRKDILNYFKVNDLDC